MSKRLLVQTVAAFVLGISYCFYQKWYIPAGMVLLFLGTNICRWKEKKRKQMVFRFFLWCACFWFGMQTAGAQQEYRGNYEKVLKNGQEAYLQGVIARKEEKQDQCLVYLNHVILQIGNKYYHTNQILIYLNTDEYSIGKTLVAKGNIESFRQAGNDGNFDEQQYYKTLKTDCRFAVSELIGCYGKENYIAEKIYQLRQKLKRSIISNMNEKYAGILNAMILGDKSLLPREIQEQYQKAGISHILVISGLHISMLGTGVFRLLRRSRLGIITASLLSLILLFCYGSMIGMGASTVRALVMYLIGSVAGCIGRTYDRPTALAVSVFVMLYQNPFLLEYSGFQFSVAAIIGVILAGKGAKSWKVSGMIQLTTMPIAAYCYYELPLWSLPVNLLVIPLVNIVVSLGMIGSLTGIWFVKMAHLIFLPIQLVLSFYEKISLLCLHLPYAQWVVGQPKPIQIFGFYLLLCLFLTISRLIRGKSPSHRANAAFGIGVASMLLILSYHFPKPPQIDVLDVGQGDAICIQANKNMNFFIDGGSSDVGGVGKYRIEPYLKCNGIARIDYWFISHMDTDHVSGLIELLEREYPVKHLVLTESGVKNENWETVITLAKKQNIPIYYIKEGDIIQAGDHQIRCIFPVEGFAPTDINAGSMVLIYQVGSFRGIFTGDITSKEEEQLIAKYRQEITYYKAAHHGSKYSSSEAWLEQLSPKISTISCSLKNSYGHPGKAAVEHIRDSGSDIYMTMEGGQVRIVIREDRMEVSMYRFKKSKNYIL